MFRNLRPSNDNIPDHERLRLARRSVAIGLTLLTVLGGVIYLQAKDIERAFLGPRTWPSLVSRDAPAPLSFRRAVCGSINDAAPGCFH